MKLKLSIILIVFCSAIVSGQNMIPNPSFEDTISLNFGLKYAAEWTSPNTGTPDYLSEYHTIDYGVPHNYAGSQLPLSGKSYFGILIYALEQNNDSKRYREYIQSTLTDSLKKDSVYCLQLHISLADSSRFASKGMLGIHFSETAILANNFFYLPYTPQIIISPDDYITEKEDWLQFDFKYQATGGEKYITIGNFNDSNIVDTFFVGGGADAQFINSYYYIDSLFLGDCDSVIGLPEINLNQQITVYPNPAKEQLFISYEGNEKLQLKLYNLVGQTVEINQRKQAEKNIKIPLNHLSKGVYFLEIIAGEQRISRKVIKR